MSWLKKLIAYPIVRPTISTKVTIVTLRDKQLPKLIGDASQMLYSVCRELVRNKIWTGAQLA